MAVCQWCSQEMLNDSVRKCSANREVEYPDGEILASLSHQDSGGGRCIDCGVAPTKKHHPGCDRERCPRCLGQLISCGCLEN